MKIKRIKVCDAIEFELRVKYPRNHQNNNTIGYTFIVNPDKKDKLINFAQKCIKLNGGESWNVWEGIKEEYPINKLKEYWEIRDVIFGEVEEVMDKVEKIWKKINKD